jgi:hypothetical protein
MIDPQGLLNDGILGVVLGWFMFRMEKVVNNNTNSLGEFKTTIQKCKRR